MKPQEIIEKIEKDLKQLKGSTAKRRYLLRIMANIRQHAIKTGDPFEGLMNPAYKFAGIELKYIEALGRK